MSVQLQRGGNVSLTKTTPDLKQILVGLGWDTTSTGGAAIDLDSSAFMVTSTGKIPSDDYFIFFNQLKSPEGSVQHQGDDGRSRGDDDTISVNLSLVPATIQKIVFTVTLYEAEERQQNFGMVRNTYIRVLNQANQQELARYNLSENFTTETAMILGELYRHNDEWKFRAVGQGFAGGLPAMANTFGVSSDEAPAAEPPPSVPPSSSMVIPKDEKQVMLEKKLASAPQILSLVKTAQVSLQKVNLGQHRAKVALCLDISGSMYDFYKSGKIQQLVERVLALACRFDDDGSVDVFLFGKEAYSAGQLKLDNFQGFIKQAQKKHRFEGTTYYDKAMRLIRQFYFPMAAKPVQSAPKENWLSGMLSSVELPQEIDTSRNQPVSAAIPIYVMFVTDGEPNDKDSARQQLRWASFEPIFWQFMAIGDDKFRFLESLDDLTDRYVDNADFFSVSDPATIADEKLYDLLMQEYPKWVTLAQQKRLLS